MPGKENYSTKLENKISRFSAQFMNDAKWFKLFKALSEHCELITKCYEVSVWDEEPYPRLLEIQSRELFEHTFKSDGIKDITSTGPCLFKEIRWLEFPHSWLVKPANGGAICKQNLNEIEDILSQVGVLEIEKSDTELRVYGYK